MLTYFHTILPLNFTPPYTHAHTHKEIVFQYLLQCCCHLKIAHPHQTSKGKLSCSQDYPRQPIFQDRTVQAERIQVWDNATTQPSPICPCSVHVIKQLTSNHFLLNSDMKHYQKESTTFPIFQFRNANATLKIYVLTAHKRMKTRSSPFSRCKRNKEGKAYMM